MKFAPVNLCNVRYMYIYILWRGTLLHSRACRANSTGSFAGAPVAELARYEFLIGTSRSGGLNLGAAREEMENVGQGSKCT